MCGYVPSLVFTRWRMQYMERELSKYVLKTRFYSNYCNRYSGTDTQGSQEFTLNFSFICRQFIVLHRIIDLPGKI